MKSIERSAGSLAGRVLLGAALFLTACEKKPADIGPLSVNVDSLDTSQEEDEFSIEACNIPGEFGAWELYEMNDAETLRRLNEETGMNTYIVSSSPEYVDWILENAAEAGFKVYIQFKNVHHYTDADGNFDLASLLGDLNELRDPELLSRLKEHYENGTLGGIIIGDDIDYFTDEDGNVMQGLTASDILAIEKAMRDIFREEANEEVDDTDAVLFPGLPMVVRHDIFDRPEGDYNGSKLTWLNQHHARKGDVRDYAEAVMDEVTALRDELGVEAVGNIWGVNFVDGGVGPDETDLLGNPGSSVQGTRDHLFYVTPCELCVSASVMHEADPQAPLIGWKLSLRPDPETEITSASVLTQEDYLDAYSGDASVCDPE